MSHTEKIAEQRWREECPTRKARLEKDGGHGWSQEYLAREAGIGYATLRKIELGGTPNPSRLTIVKLARTLGMTAVELWRQHNYWFLDRPRDLHEAKDYLERHC